MGPKIFGQKQIARAAEFGLGTASPWEIDVVAADNQRLEYRNRVVEELNKV